MVALDCVRTLLSIIVEFVSLWTFLLLDPDLETISEETNIPYSTARRKIEKMCSEGVLDVRRENQKLLFSISKSMNFAHPDQIEENINKRFQDEVMDIVVKSLSAIILERKK